MERVVSTSGDNPILIIAPHDPDDTYTGLMAEIIALKVKGYLVVNYGWERSSQVDQINSKANCNDVSHCKEDVVREEFLEPIEEYVEEILNEHEEALLYILHGVGKQFEKIPKPPEIIVGYGAGENPSYSCEILYKDAFLYLLNEKNISAYEGKAGGLYAARSKNNLNQYFRKHNREPDVHSMQIEISKSLRTDEAAVALTADKLATCISNHLHFVEMNQEGELPNTFDKDWHVTKGCFPSI
jgi:hypothetical protein